MIKNYRILYCVLDWGLGHATRSIPIIDYLVDEGHNVMIAGSGNSGVFMRNKYPKLEYFELPDYNIRYAKGGVQILSLIFQSIRLIPLYKREKQIVNKLVSDYQIDYLISDNRFGAFSKKCKSYYITHQLKFKIKGIFKPLQSVLTRVHMSIASKYSGILVPDNLKQRLAGDISSNNKLKNIYYLGALSQFQNIDLIKKSNLDFDWLFILSGPEPQRSVLEKILLEIANKNSQKKIVLVRGILDNKEIENPSPNIEVIKFANKEQLKELILNAKQIICRSGYSTIMDLWYLKRKAILVPTPGQPEQIYLANYLKTQFGFITVNQKNLLHSNFTKLEFDATWSHAHNTNEFQSVIKNIIV